MSALNYIQNFNLVGSDDSFNKLPTNIGDAIENVKKYIKSQLPEVVEVEFIPICFDMTFDQKKLVIGGQYGNLAIFDLLTKKMTKDIELISKSIISVSLALDDKIVIAATEDCTIFFLEFPSFYLLHSIVLQGEKIVMKVGTPKDTLYLSDFTNKIKILNIETYNEQFIEAELRITYFDLCNDGNMIAFALENGSINLYHWTTDSLLQSTGEYSSIVEILKFSQNTRFIAAGFADFTIKV